MKMLILIGLTLFINLISQTMKAQQKDVELTIYEPVINKFLDAVGPISDTAEYKILLIKSTYNWQVLNPLIRLKEGDAFFESDVRVETGPFSYKEHIRGNVDVEYIKETNKIALTVKSAVFPVQTKVFGKEITIKNIDLATFYKEPILFDGPVAAAQDIEFEMPDGSVKNISAIVDQFKLRVLEGRINMVATLDFIENTVSKTIEAEEAETLPGKKDKNGKAGKHRKKNKKTKK